jgi:hypothetical protein
MRNESRARIVLWHGWSALSVPICASALAVVVSILVPATDGTASPQKVNHPSTCRACAWTNPKARAAIDALLIRIGAAEGPSDSDGLQEGASSISHAAPTGMGG